MCGRGGALRGWQVGAALAPRAGKGGRATLPWVLVAAAWRWVTAAPIPVLGTRAQTTTRSAVDDHSPGWMVRGYRRAALALILRNLGSHREHWLIGRVGERRTIQAER